MDINRSLIMDNWAEIVLESYPDVSQQASDHSQQDINAEWRNCFMTDFETKRILARAA